MPDNQLPSELQQTPVLGESRSQKILVGVAVAVVIVISVVMLVRKKGGEQTMAPSPQTQEDVIQKQTETLNQLRTSPNMVLPTETDIKKQTQILSELRTDAKKNGDVPTKEEINAQTRLLDEARKNATP